MLNLLSNAVKFTPDGGRVDVSARSGTTAASRSRCSDTGIGIAPEDQAAVFEEFRQVGRDYTRKAEGTGLGLALTKRFVELHGGDDPLESAPGKGSTFTFTLPTAEDAPMSTDPDRRRQREEHEARARRAAAKGYADARGGHRRGRRASSRKEQKPDLVLMDIQLPGINGIEAFRQLRADAGDARDPGGRAHRLGDADRPQRDHRGRLRRLHRQADQREGVPRDREAPGGARPKHDARRRSWSSTTRRERQAARATCCR